MSVSGAGRDRALDLLAGDEPEHETADCGARAGQRARVDGDRLDRVRPRDRRRSVPLPGVQRSRVGARAVLPASATSRSPRRPNGGTINALDPNLKPFIDRGASSFTTTAGATRRSRRSTAPSTTGACWSDRQPDHRPEWLPALHGGRAWATAAAGKARTRSTWSARLEQWVEHGKAPDQIVASHATDRAVDRTRPLCPYPQIAAYNGTGNIDEAASFTCKAR